MNDQIKLTIPEGVLGLVASRNSSAPDNFTFCLEGDLNQMSQQKAILSCHFEIKQRDVYPVLKNEDVPQALKFIFDNRVPGWWHYKEKYVTLNICTVAEYNETLRASVNQTIEEVLTEYISSKHKFAITTGNDPFTHKLLGVGETKEEAIINACKTLNTKNKYHIRNGKMPVTINTFKETDYTIVTDDDKIRIFMIGTNNEHS
jgi:hypothetical protein